MVSNSSISLRRPSTLSTSTEQIASSPLVPPDLAFLSGVWHVTHSTLPMWRTKRNVRITYTPLPASSDNIQRIDDLVNYQSLDSEKVHSVHGVDTTVGGGGGGGSHDADGWAWHWRGKGWLMIASSRWEVLGYGEEEGEEGGEQWVVTYFAKTLFTPAGMDVYSRSQKGLSEGLLSKVKDAMRRIEDEGFHKLVDGLFEVRRDGDNV